MRRLLGLAVAIMFALPAQTPADNGCDRACVERVKLREYNKHRRAAVRPYLAWIKRTAQCESGGRWWISTGNGFYGGMQFTLQSWQAVGGRGYPHQNTKLEQMYRSVRLLRLQGRGAWPVCG